MISNSSGITSIPLPSIPGSIPGGLMGANDRSQRSVFVGNIPYEATEEELKEVFQQAGPVLSFRLVHDRETGKPKGYGFCEYMDVETAMSAMRNLNGQEFRGRQLRVDSATGDKSREELAQLQITPPTADNPFGPPIDPEHAPEAISRAVASLPPEQMYELMKQMKTCIQNNPNEARNMLLQNPQLAYALLQAQVVMRIVDPQVALAMLHREAGGPPHPPVLPPFGAQSMGGPPMSGPGPMPPGGGPPAPGGPSMPSQPPVMPPPIVGSGDSDYRQGFNQPSAPRMPPVSGSGSNPPTTIANVSTRSGVQAGDEQEKVELIQQVLRLTDEQISMLPPDERNSVLLLKEQLRGSQL